ncbi:unnamed protein product [Ambrosiozyma monospora]|uniref:Unnamed protein product n=1 Tax=Ambrosiozyma monospora TaxID=43982 RepID=A0A9W6Z010_AMBMO|nr:unnamed protein product [Ambrosiozyma monospora]
MQSLNSNETLPSWPVCRHYWDYDDFTTCGKNQLLEKYPAYLAILSVALVLIRLYNTRNTKSSVALRTNSETEPLLCQQQLGFGAVNEVYEEDNSSESQLTIAQKHFDIKETSQKDDDGNPLGTAEIVFRDFSEKLKVALESILLVLQLAISASPFFFKSVAQEWKSDNLVPYYNLVFWGYLFILGAIRLATISNGLGHRLPDLWYHSFFLYTIYLTGSFFLLRSAILGHTNSKYGAWFYISQFFISSLLFLVSGSFNYGDKPVAFE